MRRRRVCYTHALTSTAASWTSIVADRSLGLGARLELSLSACQMLRYWRSNNMFCWAFQAPAFGVDRDNRIIKLSDVSKLTEANFGSADACTTDRQCVPRL